MTLETHPLRIERDGTRVVTSSITAPNGATGWVERAYNPAKHHFEMRNAFFEHRMPRWIESDPPMVEGKGVPTVAYLTMRCMKLLGVEYGALKTVKICHVQDIETVLQLEHFRRKGMSEDDSIRKIHSFLYTATSLVQSGHRVEAAVLSAGVKTPLNSLLSWYERHNDLAAPPDSMIVSSNEQKLGEYGIRREDVVHWDFDIDMKVESFGLSELGKP